MTNIIETVNYINNVTQNFEPEIAVILGSGLGDFADSFESVKVPYGNIPNFSVSSIVGHKSQLVFAEIFGKKVVMMQGRFHYYEGYSINQVVYPISVFKKLGVKKIIITNAAGGVNSAFSAGDLMLITDHINLMGTNPLIGKNCDDLGVRFPDMPNVYAQELRNVALECAAKLGISMQQGVYAANSGPNYETPAEVRMLQVIGADAVGMSTVPEAMFANYCGIKVLGISCITNLAAGLSPKQLSHDEVVETANIIKEKFKNLLSEIIKSI
jgi:purine-nucleoside phosphorylase